MRKKTGARIIGGLLFLGACAGCGYFLIRSGLFPAMEQKLLAIGFLAAVMVFGFMLSTDIVGSRSTGVLIWLAAGCALALCLRCAFLDKVSGDYRNFLSVWVQYFRDNNGYAGLSGSVGDYNVTYLYFLALFSYSPLHDLFLIKLLSIAFDFVLAFYVMKLVGALKGSAGLRAVAFFATLFLPTVVINGAYWGQCDSIYAAFALGALYYAIEDKMPLSLVMLGIAISFKLQTVFILPFWAILLVTGRLKFRWLPVLPAAYFATILPALLLGKPLGEILSVYVDQTKTYASYLNMNAPSVFAFFTGLDVDKGAVYGIAAAALFCVLLFVLAWSRRRKLDKKTLCLFALAFCIGVPFFLPHMHDRYFFLADVLALALVWVDWKLLFAALLTQAASLICYWRYFKGTHIDIRLPAAFMCAALVLTAVAVLISVMRHGRRKKS